ncbi:hypothetical protein B0H14DRAFT_1219629 [Mycena olivaceomarginata]|nr:hypothetical protein B0H14DRAFT_1219629 [Mycena olivaceomarginata]
MIVISFIRLAVNLESVPRNDEVYMITSNDDLEDPTRGCPCISRQTHSTRTHSVPRTRTRQGARGRCWRGRGGWVHHWGGGGRKERKEGKETKEGESGYGKGTEGKGSGGTRSEREGRQRERERREGKRTRGGKAQKGTGEWSYGERHIVQM